MKKLFGLSLFIFLFLISCAPKKAPSVEKTAPIIPGPIAAPGEGTWEKILQGARKEGKVVIYSTLGSETTTILRKAFMEKYGVAAEFVAGRGGEMAQKLLTERKHGLYLVDLWQGGNTSAITLLKPQKTFDSFEPALILPEVTEPKNWVRGLDFVDKDRTIFPYFSYVVPPMAINTNLVKPEEIKSYRDLLAPRWKGKLSMQDPASPGTAIVWFRVTSEFIMDLDYMRALAKQEPVILRDRHLQVLWLAQGKYPVAIAPQSDVLGTFEREAAPIKKHLTLEGAHTASGSANLALINQAPHPNAARLYINWVLGREAQTLHSKANLLPSARVDVPTDHVDPFNLMQPGVKYIKSDDEDFVLAQPEGIKIALEIFGHLIR